jgi:hypothetical protein
MLNAPPYRACSSSRLWRLFHRCGISTSKETCVYPIGDLVSSLSAICSSNAGVASSVLSAPIPSRINPIRATSAGCRYPNPRRILDDPRVTCRIARHRQHIRRRQLSLEHCCDLNPVWHHHRSLSSNTPLRKANKNSPRGRKLDERRPRHIRRRCKLGPWRWLLIYCWRQSRNRNRCSRNSVPASQLAAASHTGRQPLSLLRG